MVVPASAGGGSDVTGRVTFRIMERYLDATLVTVNMAGAGGTLGSRHVRDARPDGYTALYVNDLILAGRITGLVDYSYEAFRTVGISLVARNTAFVTHNRFTTFESFVNAARANPGTIRIGVETGTYTAQMAVSIATHLNLDIVIVDTGPLNDSVAALAGNHIDATAGPIGMLTDFIESGMFIPHALLGTDRDPAHPNIPTLFELGVEFYRPQFFVILLPLNTPDAIVTRFSNALERTVNDPEFIEAIEALHFTPYFMPPREAIAEMQRSYRDLNEFQRLVDEFELRGR
jgi:tripartite-type tricarboxylate transporter receptor subunit TctC